MILVLGALSTYAQTYNMPTSGTTSHVTCGGTFYDSGGSGANYSPSTGGATVTFTSSTGQSLQFTFTSFHTQQNNDLLTIYDGPNTSSPIIGTFSGVTSPGIIVSSTSSLTFRFQTNANNNKSGWTANISCVSPPPAYNMANSNVITCDALFYDSGGPNGNYGNNENFVHTFTTSTAGQCIKFTFYTFNIASGDVLNVYDGPNTSSPLMGSYTGATIPNVRLLSSSGSLTFQFTSNNTGTNIGWSGVLSCEPCPAPLAATATYTMYTVGLDNTYCGGNMVNTCSGTIADNGGLSGNYSNNINQIYRNFCPNTPGMCLRMDFYSMNIVSPDWLIVASTPTQNGPSLSGNLNGSCSSYANCVGQGVGPYTSYDQSGCLSLRFYSNNTGNNSGFAATFTCVPCPNGPTGTANYDCINAIPVCSNASIDDASTGPGLISDGGAGCMLSENYTNWYKITIQSSGTLGLTIDPITNSDDYDFVLFGPGVTCSALGNPIRCSYAANTGNTGMGNGATDVSENVMGNGWVSTLNVTSGQTYYLCVNKWSNGGDGFTLIWDLTNGASLDCTVLPVTLTSFSCTQQGNHILLEWHTATEFNNKYFIIERSKDGENFDVLATVPGKGTSLSESIYFIADPLPGSGSNYYRLSQVDYNGSKQVLQTSTCSFLDEGQIVDVRVFDLAGRLLHHGHCQSSDLDHYLHTLALPSGLYAISVIHTQRTTSFTKYLKNL
ncbi:MAG: CUB domain-containing protein [Chitinophagales bacterium]|nr:CUB domain-containing protein [Chitinophagales bacterium]MDW8428783.1 CUB domain-containing protein [Chitinophagales bacterium]